MVDKSHFIFDFFLRTWDSRIQVYTSTDRNLSQAFAQLYTLKDKLGLPNAVIEKTAFVTVLLYLLL
jgi:transcription initiation factor TFIIIB Brf1 subunit/transcription initiation factor TFIIB